MPPCGNTSTLRSQKNGDFLLHRIAVPGSCTARPARQDPEKKPSFPTVSGGVALWSTPHAAGPQHGRSRYRFQGAKPVPYLASRRQGFQAVECAEHDNKKTRNKKHQKKTHTGDNHQKSLRAQPPSTRPATHKSMDTPTFFLFHDASRICLLKRNPEERFVSNGQVNRQYTKCSPGGE